MVFLLVAIIHEVAQVVAAGSSVSPHAEEIAVTVKMIRVTMLAPMLIMIGIWIAKSATAVSEKWLKTLEKIN